MTGWKGRIQADGRQWGVGHGGFFTQTITIFPTSGEILLHDGSTVKERDQINLIYDCGSITNQSSLIDSAIDGYLNSLVRDGANCIDLLAISHFDNDHINGLDYLSTQLKINHIKVSHIWAPIFSDNNKLELLASWEDDIPAWGMDLLVDPESWFRDLFGVEVTWIEPGGEPIPPSDGDYSQPLGADNTQPARVEFSQSPEKAVVAVVKVSSGRSSQLLWEVCPYAASETLSAASSVKSAINSVIHNTSMSLTEKLIKISEDKKLLETFHTTLRTLRKKLPNKPVSLGHGGGSNPNLSSLCLYSGPVDGYKRWKFCRLLVSGTQTAQERNDMFDDLSWLGTGDIVLLKQADIDGLIRVLTSQRISKIGIISAPHHGSENNSNEQLWSCFPDPRGKIVSIEAKVNNSNPSHVAVEKILDSMRYQVFIASENNSLEWIDEFYIF